MRRPFSALAAALMLAPALPAAVTLAATVALPAAAQDARVHMTLADIEAASYSGTGDLPPGQSALTAKLQILLDRAGISPGVVDGFRGGMSASAIRAFQRKHGLPQDGRLDPHVWALLEQQAGAPLTGSYTITAQDAQGLVDAIPTDYAEKAQMETMGYTSVQERLAERFHMDERFLAQLNPGARFVPGEVINVTMPGKPIRTKVLRIIVDKTGGRVAAYDATGRLVADYPATVGSSATPSPHGSHLVQAAVIDPDYTYNPNVNFKQGDNDRVLRIPPGPNGPVGNVWIDLSKPTYGIHGTATPSRLFVNQSNGCVRLTNWDAQELAGMVVSGQTIVDFLDPGVSMAEVTNPVEPTPLPEPPAVPQTSEPHSTVLPSAPEAGAPEAMLTPAAISPSRPVARRLPDASGADPLAAALNQATQGAVQTVPPSAALPVAN